MLVVLDVEFEALGLNRRELADGDAKTYSYNICMKKVVSMMIVELVLV